MKAKVGDLFKLFQRVDHKRIKVVEGCKFASGGDPRYGPLFVATNILQEALENCDIEIELSLREAHAVQMLTPLELLVDS